MIFVFVAYLKYPTENIDGIAHFAQFYLETTECSNKKANKIKF
jgi:hypothetical protein